MRYLVAVILCLMMVSCTERKPNHSVIKNNDTIEITTIERDSASTNVIIVDESVSKKIDIQMH
tara:strand:- start:377 stop:565 length:189 start_codon:yes stop_codon:yes gene_type:complete